MQSKRKDKKTATRKNQGKRPIRPNKAQSQSFANPLDNKLLWVLFLTLTLPFFYLSEPMDPAIVPRYIYLSGWALLYYGYFHLLRREPIELGFRPLLSYFFIAFLALAGWGALANFTAIVPTQGIYMIARDFLNIIVIFAFTQAFLKSDDGFLIISKAALLVGVCMSIVGIAQANEWGFQWIPGVQSPYAFSANPTLYGSSQALLFPFILYTLYKGGKTWKSIACMAFFFWVYSLLVARTRSAWLAAIVAMIGIQFLFFLVAKRHEFDLKKWGIASGGLFASAALAVFLLFNLNLGGTVQKMIQDKAKSLAKQATEGFAKSSSTSADYRLVIAAESMEMYADHPVFGVGPNNWLVMIPEYGKRSYYHHSGGSSRIRAHNDYVQVFAERGTIGGIAWIGMWVLTALMAFNYIWKKRADKDKTMLAIFLAGGFAAFGVDMFFSFPNERYENVLYVSLMWAMLFALYQQEKEGKKTLMSMPWAMAIGAVAIIAFNLFLSAEKYRFEKNMKLTKAYMGAKRYDDILRFAEEGISPFVPLGPLGDPLELYAGISYKEKGEYDKAIEMLDKSLKYHPNSSRAYSTLGTIYTAQQKHNEALDALENAYRVAPAYDVVVKNLGIAYYNNGRYKEAVEKFDQVDITEDWLKDVYNNAKAMVAQGQ